MHSSSNGPRQLVFSMKRENENRDLFILDLDSRALTQLTDDLEQDYHPYFTATSDAVIYASDTNIRKVDRTTKKVEVLTDSITAANYPSMGPGGLFVGVFHSQGWELEFVDDQNLSLIHI